MRVGPGRNVRILTALGAAVAAVAAVLVPSRPAHAHHTNEQRLTENTAYTLPRNHVRLGLFKLQYGVFDPLMIGTYTAPWIVALANLQLKWRVFQSQHWAASLELGLARLDVSRLRAFEDEPGDAIITVGTIEPALSYRFDERFTLSATIPYSKISVDGTIDTEVWDGALQGAVDNLQATATFEWRWTRVTALVLHARYLIVQRVYGDGSATLRPDDYTTIHVDASAESGELDFRNAWSIVPSLALSWKTFNLRFGVGYGNWSVPPVNFVLPKKTVVPDLDAYFVF